VSGKAIHRILSEALRRKDAMLPWVVLDCPTFTLSPCFDTFRSNVNHLADASVQTAPIYFGGNLPEWWQCLNLRVTNVTIDCTS